MHFLREVFRYVMTWIYVIAVFGRPAVSPSYVAKTLMLDITLKVFNQFFFIPTLLVRTTDFYHFTTFIDLDLAWWSQGQRKTQSPGFMLSYTLKKKKLLSDLDKIQRGDEAIQTEHPETTLKILCNKGSNCCFTDCV